MLYLKNTSILIDYTKERRIKMSVPKNRRTLAETEYYHNALKLREEILDLLIRDFGVKIKKNDFEFLKKSHEVSKEDVELLEYLCNKYRIAEHILYEFPAWFMEYERKYLMDGLRRFMTHIRYADAITVRSDKMHEYRRYHIIQARTECYMLMDEMDYVVKVFPVDMNKYLPLIDTIHYEIKLLSRLEKLDNDRYRKWKRKGDKRTPQHEPTEEITTPSCIKEEPIKTPFD